jgi:pimeloyl-ACP methyl ester carboxylesterase
VLALHGFPDDASTFDALGTGLAATGYEVVAPYLRGYAPSPTDGDLSLPSMVADAVAVLDALPPAPRTYLVGHDYGAQIGYTLLAEHGERFAAAVLLAGAHPAAIARNIARHPRQWWRSRYIVFFQLGRPAEAWVGRRSFRYVEQLWRRWSPGFVIDPAHRARVKRTLAASMPAPVAMYRAGGFDSAATTISVPTSFVSGERDGCASPALSDGQEGLFDRGYQRYVWPGIGRYPHLEDPDRTAAVVTSWFGSHGAP